MRLILILFAFSMVIASSLTDVGLTGSAKAAEDCTGDDCPPPAQGSGGHDCEKKEQTTS